MAASPMKQEWKAAGSYGTLGLEVVMSILVGLFIGRWLDAKLNTEPILSIVWFFFGVGAAGRAVYRTWKDMQIQTAREEREQGNPAPLLDPKPDPKPGRASDDDDARWRLDRGQTAELDDEPAEKGGDER